MNEIFQIPQGRMYISKSDENFSNGLLILNPGNELEKHNRPVDEELTQILGETVIRIFKNNGQVEKFDLKENDQIVIPKNVYHTHSNPGDKASITAWSFNGDITEVIDTIRTKQP